MNLSAIKKYPSQISSAFKRFPLASSFTVLTFLALVIDTEFANFFSSSFARLFLWLGIYPIAATIIALTTALVQESRKNTSQAPQAIASGSWLALSIILVFTWLEENTDSAINFAFTVALIYIVSSFGFLLAPFWKQKNENGFWVFLQRNIKAILAAVVVSAILLGAIEGLVFGFSELFDADTDEDVYLYIFYFCSSIVAPILLFSGIPSIDECLEEPPALSKFATSTIRFLFIPVLAIGTLLFYGYIFKFIALWDMPLTTTSFFVAGFMIYLLVLITVMYPARLAPKPTVETRLLKIFPAACIPLVVLMSIDIHNMLEHFGIDVDYIYAIAVNIFFYAIIAIFLIDKIERKSRWIAIIFCALFFVSTNSPINAFKITHHVWMNNIKKELANQGYNKFPLNEEDTKNFIYTLKGRKDKESEQILGELFSIEESKTKELQEFFTTTKKSLKDLDHSYQLVSDPEDDDSFDPFRAYINLPDNTPLTVPTWAKKALIVDHFYNHDEFEFSEDSLFFRYKPEHEEEDADTTVYSFKISREELKKAEKTTIESNEATLELQYLATEEWSKDNRSLQMRGILFLK